MGHWGNLLIFNDKFVCKLPIRKYSLYCNAKTDFICSKLTYLIMTNFCRFVNLSAMSMHKIPSFNDVRMCKLYRIRQNFRVGKLSRLCTKHTIHWKTFVVHQAHAIMYCTQQTIQGENFHDWLKNRENCESFPTRKFCRIR